MFKNNILTFSLLGIVPISTISTVISCSDSDNNNNNKNQLTESDFAKSIIKDESIDNITAKIKI